MKILFVLFAILHVTLSLAGESKQLIMVLAQNWDTSEALLYRFEKNRVWEQVGKVRPVVIGRNGMGWGRGISIENSFAPNGPIKNEGDGKAPAGMFALGTAFGNKKEVDFKWPYQASLSTSECIDDSQSLFYNQIVDSTQQPHRDWKTSEKMLRSDQLYDLGLVIKHNMRPVIPKMGSCLFLHVWRSQKMGTAGCTAMNEKHLKEIIHWLKESDNPVLLQLPVKEYLRLKSLLKLPEIPTE